MDDSTALIRFDLKTVNSNVVKLERCAKLTELSDLRCADRGVNRDGATAAFSSSTQKASAAPPAPPWSVVMSVMSATAGAARSTSDPLDGQCMLTAELTVVLGARLSTAAQGDIPSTMRDLMIIDIDCCGASVCMRSKRAAGVQTFGSCSIKR